MRNILLTIILTFFLQDILFCQNGNEINLKTGVGIGLSNNPYYIESIDYYRFINSSIPISVGVSLYSNQFYFSETFIDISYNNSEFQLVSDIKDTLNSNNAIFNKKMGYLDLQILQNWNYYNLKNLKFNLIGGMSGGILVRGSEEKKGIYRSSKNIVSQFNSFSFSTNLGQQIVIENNKFDIDLRITWRKFHTKIVLNENNNHFPINFYLGLRYKWNTLSKDNIKAGNVSE